jgi:NhaP-type Na+/H+ or K+/H+ antiporter
VFCLPLHRYLPPRDSRPLVELRCALLVLAGVLALFGAPVLGFDAFGALATIVCAFVARMGWKRDWDALGRDPAATFFNDLWYVFEPILFGTIGAEIDFKLLKVGD